MRRRLILNKFMHVVGLWVVMCDNDSLSVVMCYNDSLSVVMCENDGLWVVMCDNDSFSVVMCDYDGLSVTMCDYDSLSPSSTATRMHGYFPHTLLTSSKQRINARTSLCPFQGLAPESQHFFISCPPNKEKWLLRKEFDLWKHSKIIYLKAVF